MKKIFLLAAAGLLAFTMTGCGSSDDGVQRYSWPLATASPEVLLHRFLLRNLLKKSLT